MSEKLGRNPFDAPKRAPKKKPAAAAEIETSNVASESAPDPSIEPAMETAAEPAAAGEQLRGELNEDKPRGRIFGFRATGPAKLLKKGARALADARKLKMERFALLRFDRNQGKPRFSLVSLSVTHPTWTRTGSYELGSLSRGKVALSLLSVRVQS